MPRQCNILQWIEGEAPKLAEAIDALCMRGQFLGRKKGGVTYVHPEKKVWEEIVKLSGSEKVGEAEKAISMLEAHVVPTSVKTAADFEGTGSWLGAHFKGSVKGNSFVLESGGVISPEPSFKPLRYENFFVWSVKGSVPMKADGFKPEELVRKSRAVTGGGSVELNRSAIIETLEQKYAAALGSAPGKEGFIAGQKVWIQAAHALMNSLIVNRTRSEQHGADLLMGLTLVDPCAAATVYLLLEARTQGTRLISDDSIHQWAANGLLFEHPDGPRSFLDFFKNPKAAIQKLCPEAASAAIFSNPDSVHRAFESWARDSLLSRPAQAAENYKKCIAKIVQTNQVGDVSGVFPAEVQATLSTLPDLGKRMTWQGYLRYSLRIIEGGFHEGRTNDQIASDFKDLVTVSLKNPEDVDQYSTGLLSDGTTEIANRDRVYSFLSFVNSTDSAPPVLENHATLTQVEGNPNGPPLNSSTTRLTSASMASLHGVATHAAANQSDALGAISVN